MATRSFWTSHDGDSRAWHGRVRWWRVEVGYHVYRHDSLHRAGGGLLGARWVFQPFVIYDYKDEDTCMCLTAEDGWRPCPEALCELPHHHHVPPEGAERPSERVTALDALSAAWKLIRPHLEADRDAERVETVPTTHLEWELERRCRCGHAAYAHLGEKNTDSCFFEYNCGCKKFEAENRAQTPLLPWE